MKTFKVKIESSTKKKWYAIFYVVATDFLEALSKLTMDISGNEQGLSTSNVVSVKIVKGVNVIS